MHDAIFDATQNGDLSSVQPNGSPSETANIASLTIRPGRDVEPKDPHAGVTVNLGERPQQNTDPLTNEENEIAADPDVEQEEITAAEPSALVVLGGQANQRPSNEILVDTPVIHPKGDVNERGLMQRDLRRAWMSAPFKREPHTVILASIRMRNHASAPMTAHVDPALLRTAVALSEALRGLGTVYTFGPTVFGILAADKSLRHAMKIADGVRKALDAQNNGVIFAAGIATLHKDDDPAIVLCAAERCLASAERSMTSTVTSELDTTARRPVKTTFAA